MVQRLTTSKSSAEGNLEDILREHTLTGVLSTICFAAGSTYE